MAKKIQVLGTVEEIQGAEIKLNKKQYKAPIEIQEAPKSEAPKKINLDEVMNEVFMKEIHANYFGALPKTIKEFVEEQKLEELKAQDNLEFVMLTQESRKVYYLIEVGGTEPLFIGQYKSIMEVKIFVMKMASLLGYEMKAHYFKPGRKNQSTEKISGKTYFDKLEKYTHI